MSSSAFQRLKDNETTRRYKIDIGKHNLQRLSQFISQILAPTRRGGWKFPLQNITQTICLSRKSFHASQSSHYFLSKSIFLRANHTSPTCKSSKWKACHTPCDIYLLKMYRCCISRHHHSRYSSEQPICIEHADSRGAPGRAQQYTSL